MEPPPPSKTELSDSCLVCDDDMLFLSGLSVCRGCRPGVVDTGGWLTGDPPRADDQDAPVGASLSVMATLDEVLIVSWKTESGEARSGFCSEALADSWAEPPQPPASRCTNPLGLGLPRAWYSLFTFTTGQPGELGMFASGDDVDVSATLSPGAAKFIGEGASDAGIPSGEPADPRDTGESEKRVIPPSKSSKSKFTFYLKPPVVKKFNNS